MTENVQEHVTKSERIIVTFNVHPVIDADIVAKFEERRLCGETPSAYIRRLIRDNIKHGDIWNPKE